MNQVEAQIINRVLVEHGRRLRDRLEPLGRVMPPPNSYDTSRNSMYVIELASGVRPDQVIRLADAIDDQMTRHRRGNEPTLCRFLLNPFAVVVPKVDPKTVYFRDMVGSLKPQALGTVQLTLGQYYPHAGVSERRNTWLRINLCDPGTPHLLFAGTTGSGKSNNEKAAVLSAAITSDPRHLGIILIDGKGMDFPQLGNLPHLMQPVVYSQQDTLTTLRRVIAEMDRRRSLAGDDPYKIAKLATELPQILIAVDEIAVLFEDGNSPIAMAAKDILQRGRGVGVHFVGGIQKPSAATVGSISIANLPTRCCGKTATMEEGKYATGLKGTVLGSHRLAGNGDFLLVQNAAKVLPYQSPFIDVVGQEDIRIVDHINKWWEGKRNMIQLPQPNERGTIAVKPVASAVAERQDKHDSIVEEIKRRGDIHSVHGVTKINKDLFGTNLNFKTAEKLYERAQREMARRSGGETYQ